MLLHDAGCQDSATAYYYCDFSDHRTLQYRDIIGAIIQQLLSHNKPIPQEAAEKIRHCYSAGSRPPCSDKLFEILLSVIGMHSRVHVLIDGLEECATEVQEEISFVVKQIMSSESIVKVFISSREGATIFTGLNEFPCIRFSEVNLTHDITMFVRKTIRSKLRSGDLPAAINHPALQQDIISVIVTKAHSMYDSHAIPELVHC